MNPSFFTSILNGYLPEPHASLLNGILFGIPLKTSPLFYLELKRVGLLHLVVLSGMNITIIGSLVAVLTSRFAQPLRIFLSIAMIIVFILFVGPAPPIVRAGIMGVLPLIAVLTGRKSTALINLLFSIILIAIFVPSWLPTLSFQLSVGATLGIILFLKQEGGHSFFHFIQQELRTSLSAQVFTAPLIFIAFKQISFISPVANILVSFLITPLMILGFLTSLLGSVNYFLGLPTAVICYGLLIYMVAVIHILSTLPYVFVQF
ncbi:hypothetical protein COY90_00905 [Candidatus Roizmanbacteria bacterium CG_4_10_14_0_8_um_filter_39_9]|uniref:ComEC/Rec2-related protein domain-containing protein n=1 Tax=Candidatus Roizmanbacteria bacterium CG_4_10_14_0_8_um_filter_39_9 TaxID=1974829 RepID=A0A2M7QDT3_9BACT|nr:MAG: hypothetical protein COY90_00905 [Candidatus Roizmanbacteria bacterium CG_4_10_14_0_8_um_filter_39_9]